MKRNQLLLTAFVLTMATNVLQAQPWVISGNTPAAANFLGTTNAIPLNLKTQLAQPINLLTTNLRRMQVDAFGRVSVSSGGLSTYQKL
jgi:hypothetical protein